MRLQHRWALLWGALAILAVFCVAERPAAAQGSAAKAKHEYQRGYKLLQAGKFAEALERYERSYALVPRPRTLFNMALCEQQLGRDVDAYEHFLKFLAMAEPRDASFAAQARERVSELAKKLMGRVTIKSDPPGARVRVDGSRRSRGRTPVTIKLTPGEHYIHVSAPGATPVERAITMEPKGRQTLEVKLPLSASIVLTVDPPDASIQRAGEKKPTRGTYRARVRPGTYEFVVRRAGYATETITVQATTGGTYEQRVRLVPKVTTATLIVASSDGDVMVDGVEAVPDENGERVVAAGEHLVRVARDGHRAWSRKLHLSPGERVTLDVTLKKERRRSWLTWGGLALGTASIFGGGVLGVMAIRDVTSTNVADHSRGKTRALTADGLMVVGVAAIITVWRLSRGAASTATVSRGYRGAQ